MHSLDVTPAGNAADGLVSPPALLPVNAPLPAGVTRERALHYRRNFGVPIIPWRLVASDKDGGKPNKVPFGLWAQPEALTVRDLEQRWNAKSDLEVGVATGWKEDCDTCLVIVDCDSPEAEEWARASLPPTPWMVRTRSGGLHLGYLYPTIPAALKIKKVIKFFGKSDVRQLDILGDGGFAAMPPSSNYRWENGEPDLDEMICFDPSWFPNGDSLLVPRPRQRGGLTGGEGVDALREEMGEPASPLVFRAAQQYIEQAEPAVEGKGGRPQTFRVACTLVRDYALSFDQAWELLSDYNESKCHGPWTDDQLFEHIEGAYYRGTSEFACRANTIVMRSYQPKGASVLQTVADNEPDDPKDAEDSDLSTARQAAVDIPGAVFADPRSAFEPSILNVAAILLTRDPGTFGVLKQELKRLARIDMRDWQRAVKHTAGQIVEQLKNPEAEDSKRRRVQLSGEDEKDVRDQIVDVLAEDETVFCRDGRIASLGECGQLTHLRGGGLRSVLLDRCRFVNSNIDDNGMRRDTPATLSRPILEMLLELQPAQSRKLRPVQSVASAPFFWRDDEGAVLLHNTPGYHADSKTLLFECPRVDPGMFETPKKALDYIHWIFGDFPFMNNEEYHNYLGGLLTPLVRPLISGPVPILLIEANQQSAGKSHLAKICQILYCGFESLETSFPEDKAEMKKVLFTMAFRALAVTGFDNVEGVIKSPELCAFVTTSDRAQGRVLGTMDTANPEVRLQLIMTVNNGRCTIDVARRATRVRLRAVHSVHQTRTYNIPGEILSYVRENRGMILSALARLVQEWVNAGSPSPKNMPLLDTFEGWSKIVGSICFHAGLDKWMANKVAAQKALNVNIDEEPFVQEWFKKYKRVPQRASLLVQLCLRENLMGHVIGDKSLHSQSSSMGSWLAARMDAEIGGFRIRKSEHDGRTYFLEPILDENAVAA